MAEDWVICSELYRFLCQDSHPETAAGMIQLEALTGNMETRAGKAIFFRGNSPNSWLRERDWAIPPRIWMEPLEYPRRGPLHYRFEPLLGTIEAVGFSEADLQLEGGGTSIDDLLNPHVVSHGPIRLIASQIEINALDAAELGFPIARQVEVSPASRASPFKAGYPPPNEEIIEKAREMRSRSGMTVEEIAKNMRHEPGFENAGNVHVRAVLKGLFPRVGKAGIARK